jgi:hypothetical protein
VTAQSLSQKLAKSGELPLRDRLRASKRWNGRFDQGERRAVGDPQLHGEHFLDRLDALSAVGFAPVVLGKTRLQTTNARNQRPRQILSSISHGGSILPLFAGIKCGAYLGAVATGAFPLEFPVYCGGTGHAEDFRDRLADGQKERLLRRVLILESRSALQ